MAVPTHFARKLFHSEMRMEIKNMSKNVQQEANKNKISPKFANELEEALIAMETALYLCEVMDLKKWAPKYFFEDPTQYSTQYSHIFIPEKYKTNEWYEKGMNTKKNKAFWDKLKTLKRTNNATTTKEI